jgi:hypothetical protein
VSRTEPLPPPWRFGRSASADSPHHFVFPADTCTLSAPSRAASQYLRSRLGRPLRYPEQFLLFLGLPQIESKILQLAEQVTYENSVPEWPNVGTSYVWFSLMTFSPKGACFEIRLIGRDKNNDHVEICKTVSPLKSTEPQRKSSREGTFFLVDDLSESRGLTPEEPKYALPTGVGYRRRMAVGKDLAERVRFEPTARLPILTGSPVASRSRSAIEPSLRHDSPENGNNAEDTQRFSACWAEEPSNSEHRDSPPDARSPPTTGFSATW